MNVVAADKCYDFAAPTELAAFHVYRNVCAFNCEYKMQFNWTLFWYTSATWGVVRKLNVMMGMLTYRYPSYIKTELERAAPYAHCDQTRLLVNDHRRDS